MARVLPRWFQSLLLAALLSATAPLLLAQNIEGRISVTVFDPQNAVIPGATLELKDPATNEMWTGATQSAGAFAFVNLRPGKYTLTISAPGFQPAAYDVQVSGTKSTDV